VRGEVKDHEKAVKLFQKEAQSGQDPELKQFAQQTLPKLQQHLQMAQQLDQQARGSKGSQTSSLPRGGTSGSSTTPTAPSGATGAPTTTR
jgi:putative membrane protein